MELCTVREGGRKDMQVFHSPLGNFIIQCFKRFFFYLLPFNCRTLDVYNVFPHLLEKNVSLGGGRGVVTFSWLTRISYETFILHQRPILRL